MMEFQPQSLGKLSKHKPAKQTAKVVVLVLLLLLLGVLILPWQQAIPVTGQVIAYYPNEREQVISAPISGRLKKWYIQDGSRVSKGDIIIRMSDNDADFLKKIQLEKAAVVQQIKVLESAASTAKKNVDRQTQLLKKGISSERKYEQAIIEELKYHAEIQKAQAELTKIQISIARQESQVVYAPMDGSILNRRTGQNSVLVKQGDILATLIPDTTILAAEMFVSGNDIPLVHIGDTVRLQFEGWPAFQFSGWPSVAVGTFGAIVKLVEPVGNDRSQFRLLIVPKKQSDWPEKRYLRQGVRCHGWVLLNEVSLWYELWRKFNGFPPAIEKKPT